jgi:hypothetical protein
VDLVAVIDESVMHRPIGGAAVLAQQLRHLITSARRPNITIQVLPLDAPTQPTSWGAFLVLAFPWPGGRVHQEHYGGAHSMESMHDIEGHVEAFDQLCHVALDRERSLDRIINRVKELEL